MTAQAVAERLKSALGGEWPATGIDGFKAGDPNTTVKGIATTAMATMDVLKQAAKAGAESTKEMDAKIGKARSLGPRALGFVDPGALSTSLILEFMQWYVEGLP